MPAEHCPGSVMFLFEREEANLQTRILYTGDFRLENLKLEALTALHDSQGQPLKLDQLYLDTTFCSKEYENFPPRDEALDHVWRLVDGWIRKNGKFIGLQRSLD